MNQQQPVSYPSSRRAACTEVLHGVTVADPYRWLEDDVRNSKEVADWVAAQKAVADPYLGSLPGKQTLAARVASVKVV